MAEEAHARAKAAMDLATEMQLARLLMRDAQQLEERAKEQGVTAYLQKPVHRERPNERFLRNTLSSVAFANRRVDEDQMWRARDQQRHLDERKGRSRDGRTSKRKHRSCSPTCERTRLDSCCVISVRRTCKPARYSDVELQASPCPAPAGSLEAAQSSPHKRACTAEGMDAAQLDAFLSRRRTRGRGAVGSHMEHAGPFEEEAATPSPTAGEDSSRHPIGPIVPDWLVREPRTETTDASGSPGGRKHRSRKKEGREKKKKAKVKTKTKKVGKKTKRGKDERSKGKKHRAKKAAKERDSGGE
eukprot:evm.model.scf_256EXC.11 EVM.evm.TU.scf_256EXC.11   scf_256EXC:105132-109558(-)